MNNLKTYESTQTEKNESDFKDFYNVNFSMNKYIERLLEKVAKELGLNKSQCVRHLIYEEYQRLKEKGFTL